MLKSTALAAFAIFLFLSDAAVAATPHSATLELCEAQSMVAYGTAREAIKTGRKKAYWAWQPETSDYQKSLLDELYDRIERDAFKDYRLYGSEKYAACMQKEGGSQPVRPDAATGCFAQLDVALYAQTYKAGGGGLAGTRKYARVYLKDVAAYPQAMLDEIIPPAFKATSAQEFSDFRNALFHRCVGPIAAVAPDVKPDGAPPPSRSVKAARSLEEIRVSFDRIKGSLYVIYTEALREDRSLRGKVVVEFTIAPDGGVTACHVESSELKNAALEEKLVARLCAQRFAAEDVNPMVARYPIDFLPAR